MFENCVGSLPYSTRKARVGQQLYHYFESGSNSYYFTPAELTVSGLTVNDPSGLMRHYQILGKEIYVGVTNFI